MSKPGESAKDYKRTRVCLSHIGHSSGQRLDRFLVSKAEKLQESKEKGNYRVKLVSFLRYNEDYKGFPISFEYYLLKLSTSLYPSG